MKKKFLKGPWAEDDQRLAFWLYTGGAHVSHELDLDDTVSAPFLPRIVNTLLLPQPFDVRRLV